MKQEILDEFCETTGYCRGYARYVLRSREVNVQRNCPPHEAALLGAATCCRKVTFESNQDGSMVLKWRNHIFKRQP